MPTIKRINGYRFFFFSLEGKEPPHINVERAENVAKFWLKPVTLASSYGFKSHDLTKIRSIIDDNQELFVEKWYEFFRKKIISLSN